MSPETKELSNTETVITPQKTNWKKYIRKNTTQLGMIAVFIFIWIFFIISARHISIPTNLFSFYGDDAVFRYHGLTINDGDHRG